MKALIYVRTTHCKELAQKIIEECKKFCLAKGLEIKTSHFDVGIRPSASKHKFKGFSALLENIEKGDCIVCQRPRDLPNYFLSSAPSVPIIWPGAEELNLAFEKLFSEIN